MTDTREKGGVIYHETVTPLKPGCTVKGRIDYDVRFDRMQQHSGEHILSGWYTVCTDMTMWVFTWGRRSRLWTLTAS